MNHFDAKAREARSIGDYQAAMVYASAEDIANNGHGKSSEELMDFLTAAYSDNALRGGVDGSTWADALEYVQSLRD